jgi:hypothetical protein
MTAANDSAIRRAFELAGVELFDEYGGGRASVSAKASQKCVSAAVLRITLCGVHLARSSTALPCCPSSLTWKALVKVATGSYYIIHAHGFH